MASTLDLYTEDFPHGTPAGYEAGCRGAACPNHLTEEMMCKEAQSLYSTDYNFRAAVNAGTASTSRDNLGPTTPVKVPERKGSASDSLLAPLGTHKPKPPKLALGGIVTGPTPLVGEERVVPLDPPYTPPAAAERAKRGVKVPLDDPGFPHGTNAGYQRGCRDGLYTCPSTPSCHDAKRKYQSDYGKKKRASNTQTAPETAAQPLGEPTLPAAPSGFFGQMEELAKGRLAAVSIEDEEHAGPGTHIEVLEPDHEDHRTAAGDGSPTTNGPAPSGFNTLALAAQDALEVATGGGLALTIDPTSQGGVALTFTLPASSTELQIRVDVGQLHNGALGDLAITVGSR